MKRRILSLLLALATVVSSANLIAFADTDMQELQKDEQMAEPQNEPSEEPTPTPTETPSEEPTETPMPTETPSEEPTETPSEEPTPMPTETPSEEPTPTPTETPTEEPTETPSEEPTPTPTQTPTEEPTQTPTPDSSDPIGVEDDALTGKFELHVYENAAVERLRGHDEPVAFLEFLENDNFRVLFNDCEIALSDNRFAAGINTIVFRDMTVLPIFAKKDADLTAGHHPLTVTVKMTQDDKTADPPRYLEGSMCTLNATVYLGTTPLPTVEVSNGGGLLLRRHRDDVH